MNLNPSVLRLQGSPHSSLWDRGLARAPQDPGPPGPMPLGESGGSQAAGAQAFTIPALPPLTPVPFMSLVGCTVQRSPFLCPPSVTLCSHHEDWKHLCPQLWTPERFRYRGVLGTSSWLSLATAAFPRKCDSILEGSAPTSPAYNKPTFK